MVWVKINESISLYVLVPIHNKCSKLNRSTILFNHNSIEPMSEGLATVAETSRRFSDSYVRDVT